MKSFAAVCFAALALAGCASEPTWNTATFPEQPMYGVPGTTPTVAEAPKK
jgi:hypothetical protein